MAPAASTPPPRKRTITRVIAVVVVWLVVGAVLTVATTWGGIVYEAQAARRSTLHQTESLCRPWPHHLEPNWLSAPNATNGVRTPWTDLQLYDVQAAHGAHHEVRFLLHLTAGRPFRSMGGGASPQFRYGVWQVPLRYSRNRCLPLVPIWPGFTLNTLFYAAIAWLLCWRIPILIRRHRRRTRGLCLKCAYDRTGLAPGAVCPECGDVPRPAASVVSV